MLRATRSDGKATEAYAPAAHGPLTATDVFDTAFHLYRRHFVRLVVISALVMGPVNVVTIAGAHVLGVDALLSPSMEPNGSGEVTPSELSMLLGALAYYLVTGLATSLGYVLQMAALVAFASDAYHGIACTVRNAYQRAAGAYGRLLGTYLLLIAFVGGAYMVVGMGAMMFVAAAAGVSGGAGVVVGIAAVLVVAVVVVALLVGLVGCGAFLAQIAVVEGVAYFDAIRRNWMLVRTQPWRVLGGLVFLWVLIGVFQSAFTLSLGAVITEILYPMVGIGAGASTVTLNALGAVSNLFVQPYLVVALTAYYYNLRLKNEALDILWQLSRTVSGSARSAA